MLFCLGVLLVRKPGWPFAMKLDLTPSSFVTPSSFFDPKLFLAVRSFGLVASHA